MLKSPLTLLTLIFCQIGVLKQFRGEKTALLSGQNRQLKVEIKVYKDMMISLSADTKNPTDSRCELIGI